MLGPQDIWIALALGVFFFGAKKLPELSRSLGQAMSEFKKGLSTGAQDEAPRPADAAAKTEGTSEEEIGKGKPQT
jgi:sec-independent protein translocase protein TatA